MKVVTTETAPKAIGPYSQAVEAGGFIFLSGQIPIDPKTGSLVQAGIEEETRQVMENAGAILQAAGVNFSSVVKATIYLKSMSDFAAVNQVYGEFFSSEPPARATVEVAGLPKGVRIEIDFIAWKGLKQ